MQHEVIKLLYESALMNEPDRYHGCRLSARALYATVQIQIRPVQAVAVHVPATYTLSDIKRICASQPRSRPVELAHQKRRFSINIELCCDWNLHTFHAFFIADGAAAHYGHFRAELPLHVLLRIVS